jgi:hypothetical protein
VYWPCGQSPGRKPEGRRRASTREARSLGEQSSNCRASAFEKKVPNDLNHRSLLVARAAKMNTLLDSYDSSVVEARHGTAPSVDRASCTGGEPRCAGRAGSQGSHSSCPPPALS